METREYFEKVMQDFRSTLVALMPQRTKMVMAVTSVQTRLTISDDNGNA